MKIKEIFFYFQGTIIIIGFFITLIYLIYTGKSPESVALVIGALIGAFLQTVNYNYGSTKGSAEKTEMLYNSTKMPDKSTVQSTTETTSTSTSPSPSQIPKP